MANVLIVDDEPGIRKSLSIFISQMAYSVHTAETVDEAIRLLGIETIDTIVCDIVLPGKSGMELMQHVYDHHPEIPVIIISGEPTIETVVRAMRLGAFDYLGKPVKGKRVCEIVEAAVQKKQAHDRNERAAIEAEDRYLRLVNNLRDMVWRTDADGIVKFVNPACESILGHTPHESIGFPPDHYMTLESIEQVKDWLREALKQNPVKTNVRGKVEYVHRDGSLIPCEMNVTLILDHRMRMVGLEGITRVLRGEDR